jgi:hypothetical protein
MLATTEQLLITKTRTGSHFLVSTRGRNFQAEEMNGLYYEQSRRILYAMVELST